MGSPAVIVLQVEILFENDTDCNFLNNRSYRVKWPVLGSVARHVLSIPAASTSSERPFSVAGRTVEDRRCQLKCDTVDGILFLNTIKK